MSIFKRAWIYVKRQKVRTLIIFLVLSVISTLVLSGIAFELSANEAAKSVRKSVGGKITLDIDTSEKNFKLEGSDGQQKQYQYVGDNINDDTLNALKKVDGVSGYNATRAGESYASAVNFKYLPTGFDLGDFEDTWGSKYGEEIPHSGTMYSDKYSGFMSGKLKLVTGRHLKADDKNAILMSKELADHNKLKVGDTIELHVNYTKKITKFKIVGIFTGTEGDNKDAILGADIASNQMIMDLNSARELHGPKFNSLGKVEIFVNDTKDIKEVYEGIKNLPEVKGKTFLVNMNQEDYSTIANPLASLQGLVRILVIIITIVSVVVLALLLTIWAKTRTKETGILLSVGISKMKIIMQYIVEVGIIAIFAFSLSYFTAQKSAQYISDYVVEQLDKNEGANDTKKPTDGYVFDGSDSDKLSDDTPAKPKDMNIDVKISPTAFVLVYAVGAGIIVIAIFISSRKIMKIEPKEILTKNE